MTAPMNPNAFRAQELSRLRDENEALGEEVNSLRRFVKALDSLYNATDNFKDDSIIISLCNDSWLEPCAKYIQNLMVLANKFKAIYWKRYIIYVDYSSSYIFDKFGNQHKLINI